MNVWTFLDRNGHGIFWLLVIGLCFAFGECGDKHGCRLQCSPGMRIQSGPADAGAP